jgi:hypothetical protein
MITENGIDPGFFSKALFFLLVLFFTLIPISGYSQTYNVNFQVVDSTQAPVPAKILILGLNENREIVFQSSPNFNQLQFDPGSERYWTGSRFALLTPIGEASAELDSGSYVVIATRGLEYSIDGDTLTLPEMADTTMVFVLEHMLDVPGRISVDFHVHSAASRDSRITARVRNLTIALPDERFIDYITSGVELMVSSDHNQIRDYRPYIQSLAEEIGDLEGFSQEYVNEKIGAIAGNELGLYIQVEGDPPDCPPLETPRHVAHFNVWPLNEGPSPQPCDDVYRQPATLYDITRDLDSDPGDYGEVIQLNHPRGMHYDWTIPLPGFMGGPTGGYLHNWEYDPTLPIPPVNNGDPNSFLRIESDSSTTQNIDFDVIEIMNRNYVPYYMESRLDWFSFLNQGFRKVATGNTDSHWIFVDGCGYPRNYVASSLVNMDGFGTPEENAVVDSVLYGDLFATTGPILDLFIDGKGLGDTVYVDSVSVDSLPISIRVQAVPWIPVHEVRLIVNGEEVHVIDVSSTIPEDPYSTDPADLVRYEETLVHEFTEDSWVVLEAGIEMPLPGIQPPSTGLYMYLTFEHRVLSFTNPVFVKFPE